MTALSWQPQKAICNHRLTESKQSMEIGQEIDPDSRDLMDRWTTLLSYIPSIQFQNFMSTIQFHTIKRNDEVLKTKA